MLHGCLQFVLLNIRLIPLTNEIPAINLYIIANEPDRGSAGAKTSRYGPYVLGYRRATKTFTKWCETSQEKRSESLKKVIYIKY